MTSGPCTLTWIGCRRPPKMRALPLDLRPHARDLAQLAAQVVLDLGQRALVAVA